MTAPHLQFRHLDADVLTATGALLESAPSALSHDQVQREFQQWADAAAAAYRLPRLAVSTDTGNAGRRAADGYIPSPTPGVNAAICLSGRSVIALLTNFRRHMQHHHVPRAAGGPEDDASAWALSVYYTIRPRQLALLAAEGCVPGLISTDLREIVPHAADVADCRLIDDSMRRAIFASLRDYYGFDLDRDDRLDKLSQLAGRRVTTVNGLTRTEGGRILDRLSARAADPASRQLRAARGFIRRAAVEGRITAASRDRYLTMLNAEHSRASSDAAALTAIRDRAIDLHRDGEICQSGLSDFLDAAGLAPYNT
jgi:hypothetical protein